jgi:NAD(P)-dependent dehydrogenase (short-subunit alcohol dehydrogenase family)
MADNSRVILIIGRDSGIGLAIARKFAMEGYRIAM